MTSLSALFSWYNAGKQTEKWIAIFLLLASLLLLVIIAWLSSGSNNGSDNIMHYQITHFSWKHPELFLHHWGKPLFTLLCSPLAQFGYFGAKLFNIIAGLATAWLAYLTVNRLGYRNGYMVILFVVFTPLYFIMQMTTLTEVLFSFVLMLAVYLYFTDRFLLSALVLSFLPLARTEGIIILPIFAIAYLLHRKWLAGPLLATGFIVYSFAGLGYFHDFLWLIHQNPYRGAEDIYGSGTILHFAEDTKFLSGLPLAFLMIAGVLALVWEMVKPSRANRIKALNIFWIIFVPYAVYFIFHSILWWKGMGGSLGLTRVIAAVLPLACIVSFIGYNAVSKLLSFSRVISILFMLAIVFIIIRTNFTINKVPVKPDAVEKVLAQTADWVKNENKNGKIIYYYDPVLCFMLGLDPWETTTNRTVISDGGLNLGLLAENSFLIWDAHFGPNEGNTPLDTLLNQEHLQLLNIFKPSEPFNTLGGYNYEVYVFRRLPAETKHVNNRDILNRMITKEAAKYIHSTLSYMDFESNVTELVNQRLSHEAARSGKSSYIIGSYDEYGPGSSFVISKINPLMVFPMIIDASVYVYPKQISSINPVSLVISCEQEGKSYFFRTADLGPTIISKKWTKLSTRLIIPECKSLSDIIKVYVWHHGKEELLVDDFKAEVLTSKKAD
jgi:hypothetical protein